jgi:Domain of unknown function (DUF4082)
MMVVLTENDKLRFGTAVIDRLYLGATPIWPQFLPTDLSGLALWFDAAKLTPPVIGSNERMLASAAVTLTSTGNYNLGSRFVASVDGQITHARYWHQVACAEGHIMSVWDAAGNRVGYFSDVPGSATGWREVAFPVPIPVKAGATYTVSYSSGTHAWGYQSVAPTSLAPSLGSLTPVYASYDAFPSNVVANQTYNADLVFQALIGGRISPWPNRGSGPTGTIVGTPSPLILPSRLNGNPVVRFWANEGRMQLSGTGVDTPYTLVYVVRAVGPTVGRVAAGFYPTRNILIGYHGGMENSYFDNGWASPNPEVAWTNTWRQYSADAASSVGRLFKNGVFGGSVSASLGFGGTFAISGYDGSTSQTSDCEIAEVILYNRKLSDTDRQKVEAYLQRKWGV